MKKIFLVAIALLIFLFSISYRPIYFDLVNKYKFEKFENVLFKYEIHRYPAIIQIIKENKTIGISTDVNALNFGKISKIEGIERIRKFINFTSNDYSKISIEFHGNISKYLKATKNNFYLKPFQNITIEIIFDMKNVKDFGIYSGEVRIFVIKPKIKWLAEKEFY